MVSSWVVEGSSPTTSLPVAGLSYETTPDLLRRRRALQN